MSDTSGVQTPEPHPPEEPYVETEERFAPEVAWIWGAGERLTWLSGLVLSLSVLMGWYVGVGEEPTIISFACTWIGVSRSPAMIAG